LYLTGYLGTLSGSNQQGFLMVTAIPEPATYAAWVGVVALGLGVWRRRKARR
jgi:hypothetical protein